MQIEPQPTTTKRRPRMRLAPMVAVSEAVGAGIGQPTSSGPGPTTPVIFDASFDGSFA